MHIQFGRLGEGRIHYERNGGSKIGMTTSHPDLEPQYPQPVGAFRTVTGILKPDGNFVASFVDLAGIAPRVKVGLVPNAQNGKLLDVTVTHIWDLDRISEGPVYTINPAKKDIKTQLVGMFPEAKRMVADAHTLRQRMRAKKTWLA